MLCKTKKWGSSLGIIIPKSKVNELNLTENQEIDVDFRVKSRNVLRELWDSGGFDKKMSKKRFLELRKEVSSRFE